MAIEKIRAVKNYKTYSYEGDITLAIYYSDKRYWVNLIGSKETEPYPHGLPFQQSFQTKKEANDFREKIAEWLGLVDF